MPDLCLKYLTVLKSRKTFYQNLYYSAETKEFQRIIRDYFYQSYLTHIKKTCPADISEDIIYVLRAYCYGSAQLIFDWIHTGMTMPIEQFCDIVFMAMPACLQELLFDFSDPLLSHYCS